MDETIIPTYFLDKTMIPMIISAICFLISLSINNLLLTLIFLFLGNSEEVKNEKRQKKQM